MFLLALHNDNKIFKIFINSLSSEGFTKICCISALTAHIIPGNNIMNELTEFAVKYTINFLL
jgi:hypothetical protein